MPAGMRQSRQGSPSDPMIQGSSTKCARDGRMYKVLWWESNRSRLLHFHKVLLHKTSYICTGLVTFAHDKVHLHKVRYICTRQGTFVQDKLHLHKTRYICAIQGTFAQGSVIWERRQGSIGSLWSADTATPKSEPLMQYCNTVKPNPWCNNVTTLQTAILPNTAILQYCQAKPLM